MADNTIGKTCFRCKQIKPLSDFYLVKNRDKLRHHSYCRACANPHCSPKKTTGERFWAKVEKTQNCWLWKGASNSDGYGNLWYKGKLKVAHFVSYELHNGSVPRGLCVLHRCDNPPCVNPDHLFLGTKKQNMDDCVQKGRRVNHPGEKNGQHKLTENQVREIRRRYKERGATQKDMAKEYGVSTLTIYEVVNYRRWKHVE